MNFLKILFQKTELAWILVKRDYAMTYAGSLLGIGWMVIQNLVVVLIYILIFTLWNPGKSENLPEYTAYIFSGLLFWLPLQEMFIRGTSILSDNRNLIKKTQVGTQIFQWIPFIQMLISFMVTLIPACILLRYFSVLNEVFFIGTIFVIAMAGLFLMPLLHYLSRANVLLKDLSPVSRLATQLFFWSMPILYYPTGFLGKLSNLNPLSYPLDLYRALLIQNHKVTSEPYLFIVTSFLLCGLGIISRKKLDPAILDHL